MVGIEKYNGTGNDFVVVDAAEDVPDRRAFAASLCDRSSGITHPKSSRTGADGVLFLALEPDYKPPRVIMTLVQPDGSIAAMCGNGARCAAKWVEERTGVTEVMVDTPAGTRYARLDDDRVTIEMGRPTFAPETVPVDTEQPLLEQEVEGLTVSAVNTGVPHAVAFVDDVDTVDLETVGPAVRNAPIFPDGANVTLAAPTGETRGDTEKTDEGDATTDHRDGFIQRTYERGVEDETRACGTGAVAIVATAVRLGRAEQGRPVPVSPPGGRLEVTVTGDGALLRGPVEREFGGEVAAVEPGSGSASAD